MRTARSIRRCSILALAMVVTACQAPAPRIESAPPLHLIESAALQVPAGCRPTGSVIVDFTVLESGATANITAPTGPECLRQALVAWVASFAYAPIATPARTSIEWLLVEASKGS